MIGNRPEDQLIPWMSPGYELARIKRKTSKCNEHRRDLPESKDGQMHSGVYTRGQYHAAEVCVDPNSL